MGDKLDRTIRMKAGAKVGVDSLGRTVWTRPVEDAELELISTRKLEQILSTESAGADQLRALAEATDEQDGYLVHDSSKDMFDIVHDDELEAALKALEADDAPLSTVGLRDDAVAEVTDDSSEEDFSLVDTQMLKQILSDEDFGDDGSGESGGGFNPYDRG